MLRTGLALSILTQQPVRFVHIRARRPKPGLQAQHLASVQAAATICGATVSGDALGSPSISFHPEAVQSGDYCFKIGTAGATTLVLQTVYLPLLLQGKGTSSLRIEGGTHALMAPSGEYVTQTWASYLQAFGAALEVQITKPGFFPKGGGILQATLQPSPRLTSWQGMDALDSTQGVVECLATVGGKLPASIGERIIKQTQSRLGLPCTGNFVQHPHAKSEGVVATIIDKRSNVPSIFYALGARGKPSEKVADEAVDAYLAHRQTGCLVEAHGADQILLPLAFASGSSSYRVSAVTQHLLTHRAIISRFLSRSIEIEGELNQPGTVVIR